ncbi:hypothetical protein BMF94_1554 [Rhodotorula taiwanensis]|uniref:Uncharacterized protein n=1 Tax=Rhodotorula taiwanensis TaxID=741276 RepID=A0A2S5BF51_9BASI|nr:hypothetical protein BMF94_1554 [Rhodotorula taiwanensis]
MRQALLGFALLACAGAVSAQVNLIAQLPPSYAPLCTIQRADGSFAPNSSVCQSGVDCHQDIYRTVNGMAAYYCGAGNAACTLDSQCTYSEAGACSNGRCIGGYGLPSIGQSGATCAASGFISTENGVTGCWCNFATNRCDYKSTTVGASCKANKDSCGQIAASSTKMYCRTSDATCQPIPLVVSYCGDGLEKYCPSGKSK